MLRRSVLLPALATLLLVAGQAMALDAGKVGASPRAPAPSVPADDQTTARVEENRYAIAVIVGNRRYAHGLPEVRYAENDARAVRELVLEVLGYRDGNVIDLRNASQAEMLSIFGSAADHRGKLWSWVKPGVSDVFVYYSGHGIPGLRDKRGYLLPVDADPATPEINGYSLDLLLSNLGKLETRSTLLMIDACFSGNSAAGWLVRSASPVYVRTKAPPPSTGISVVTAARGDQVASWDETARLGLFTRHMLDALRSGLADSGPGGNGDGAVSLGELDAYLEDEMTYAARRQLRRVQQATVLGDPKSIVVPQVRPRPAPQPVARTRPPGSGVPAGSAAVRPPSDGTYILSGGSIAEAEAFVARHWDAVRRTIRTYYAREGAIWDKRGNPPQVEFAEEITRITQRRVVGVAGGSFDIAIRYRWEGGGTMDVAEATLRVAVTPDGLSVEKMWR